MYTWTLEDVPYGTEVSVAESGTDVTGWTLGTVTNSGPITVDTTGKQNIALTNPYTRDTASLKITKKLADDSEQVTIPEGTTFTITGPSDYKGPASVTYKDFKDGSYTIENAPTGEYTIAEKTDTAKVTDYTLASTTYSPEGGKIELTTDGGEVIVTNKYTRDMTEITVTKIWDDDYNGKDDYYGFRPDSVDFVVTDPDGPTYPVTLKGEGNTWTAKLSVPATKDGKPIAYTVDEEGVEPYYAKKIENEKLTITNTFAPVWGDPPVKKVVTGDKPAPTETFKFTLTAVKYEGEGKVDKLPMPEDAKGAQSMTVEIKGEGEKEFGEFPLTVAGKYTYTITEEKGSAEGYTYSEEVYTILYDVTVNEKTNALECVKTVTNKAGESKETAEEPADFVFENEYKKPVVSVKVTKVWDDGDNAQETRPESVEIKLLANGEDAKKYIVLSANADWTGAFENLDKYDADFKAITYTVEEVVPEGYTAKVTGTAADGFTVTNTLDTPDTGDHSDLMLWSTALIASLLGIVLLGLFKRRKDAKHYSR